MFSAKRKFNERKTPAFSKAKKRKVKRNVLILKSNADSGFHEETVGRRILTSKSGTISTVICNDKTVKAKSSFFADSSSDCSSDLEIASDVPIVEEVKEAPVDYYSSKNARVIVLKDSSSIFVTGMCKIRVLFGSINIFGYEIKPSKNFYKLYSLKGWAQMHFKNNMHDCEITDITRALREYRIRNKNIREISNNLGKNYAIVVCLPLQNIGLKFIERSISNAIFPALDQGFPAGFNNVGAEQELQIRSDWYNLFDYSSKHIKGFVCGAKSVGKSTILRFMINRLLLYHPEVCVVDLDPGQPEFTMSSCISVVKVKEPIFGPNFTHLQTPVRSILQNIDPAYSPQNYIDGVRELCKDLPEIDQMPTLINFMGFTKGIGLSLACAVISILSPTTVLEIKSNRGQRDFPQPLTPPVVLANCRTFNSSKKIVLDYRLISIPSACKENVGGFKPPAHLCREILTLSYFGSIIDGSLSLRSCLLPTYKIELQSITVFDSSYKLIDNESKAGVINANLVALCSPVNKEDLFNCHGFGLVRAVTNSDIYLITPMKGSLNDVTHLIVGMAQMPSAMLLDTSLGGGSAPYISEGCLTEFSQAPKRSFIPRKSYNTD